MEALATVTLYRIAWENPPSLDDMKSNQALGKEPRGDDPDVLRCWDGISLWDSLDRARAKARRHPWNSNAFVVELAIPTAVFRLQRTFSRGHYTLWGEPHDILSCVRHVHRV